MSKLRKAVLVGTLFHALLAPGVSRATELGNAYFNSFSGHCPLPTGIGTISMGTATAGNGHSMGYVVFALSNSIYEPELFTFDLTANTYSITTPGIGGPNPTSGTFTGNLGSDGFGGLTMSLTLSCGASLVGGTTFAGQ